MVVPISKCQVPSASIKSWFYLQKLDFCAKNPKPMYWPKEVGFFLPLPSLQSSPKPSWQHMWHGLRIEVFKSQTPTLPSVPRDEGRM